MTPTDDNTAYEPIPTSPGHAGRQQEAPTMMRLLLGALKFARQQQERAAAMCTLAVTDELTGLYNRRGFVTLARQQLKLARRTGRRTVLIYADVDRLKQINDECGHRAGDRVLQGAAAVLRRTLRDSDIIARIGGDEFAALATEAPGAHEEAIAARIEHNLGIYNRSTRSLSISMTVGAATFCPGDTASLEELMDEADRAMYARRHARGRGTGTSAS